MNFQKLGIYGTGNKVGELRHNEIIKSWDRDSQKTDKKIFRPKSLNENGTETSNVNGTCEDINVVACIRKLKKRVEEMEKTSHSALLVISFYTISTFQQNIHLSIHPFNVYFNK